MAQQPLVAACEVCGQLPPPGHHVCDVCWPERAILVGRASRCAECGKPRLLEKLTHQADERLICTAHLTPQERP